ncbi:MAG: serine hydrolase [SAR202 cluster bacterium]|nr:serine hydrolase [SAR202 cluster bacterium]
MEDRFAPLLDGKTLPQFLEDTETQAFIVLQDGEIVYEKYFNGSGRDSIVTSFSAAKSYVSALLGIAVMEGHIESIDDPITKYIPELLDRDPDFGRITVRHLVAMTSGLSYEETGLPGGDDALTYYYPDLRDLAINRTTINNPPGGKFLHNNYNPLLSGVVLERATGMPVATYMQEKLWKPMGAEFDASWSLDSEKTAFEKMESGINTRAIDSLRLGRLFLNGGQWDGAQLIPADWVEESTQPYPAGHDPAFYPERDFYRTGGGYYKYSWWGKRREGGLSDFSAEGNFGQFIFVSPQYNLVIVRHGAAWGLPGHQWLDLLWRYAGGGVRNLSAMGVMLGHRHRANRFATVGAWMRERAMGARPWSNEFACFRSFRTVRADSTFVVGGEGSPPLQPPHGRLQRRRLHNFDRPARPLLRRARRRAVLRRAQEHVRAGVGRREHLLPHSAYRPDAAVQPDGACAGDSIAAGQVAHRHHVVYPQRQHQPARRPYHAVV